MMMKRCCEFLNHIRLASLFAGATLLGACATQQPPVPTVEAPQSISAQRQAQQQVVQAAPAKPTLKRKIALGRVTNETNFGRSLLRDRFDDPLGKQVTDMLSKSLTDSGRFLVFERPDLGRVQEEVRLTGAKLNLIGVDLLIVGSLTEFGRKVVGETGFLSQSKRQIAFAKVDLRLVDTRTSQIVAAFSGAGQSSTESASVAGFGSQAAYDATLNDSAISTAVADAVNKLTTQLVGRPWTTSILRVDQQQVFISGGQAQGLTPGMNLTVHTRGETIRSQQSGFDITLPGKQIASIRIQSLFGDNETNQGSIGIITNGALTGYGIETLFVTFQE
jgi:curli biogenesis system outer membrane secretion channel CsgG